MSQTKAQLLDNIKDNVQIDAQKALRFADSDSSNYVAFKAPATVSSNVTWTLPSADGSANYVLATNGSGTLSWIADPAGQWTTSGSNIYFTGGNVGIGDSSPSNPLSVTGASAFNGDVTFTGASYNVTWDKSVDDLIFNDNAKAAFGTGSDLTIYHDGTNSIINGAFRFTNGDVYFRGSDTNNRGWTWDTSTEEIRIEDQVELCLGNAQDLKIYHDGSNSYIAESGTGSLYIRSSAQLYLQSYAGEDFLKADANGAVELYYDNTKKLETVSNGATVTGVLTVLNTEGLSASLYLTADDGDDNGDSWRLNSNQDDNDLTFANNTSGSYVDKLTLQNDGDLYTTGDVRTTSGKHIIVNSDSGKIKLGGSQDLEVFHDGSNSWVKEVGTGALYLDTNSSVHITKGGASESMAKFYIDGAVELYYDNNKKLETYGSGVKVYNHLRIQGANDENAVLNLYADNGDDAADLWQVGGMTGGTFEVNQWNGSSWENCIKATGGGSVELYNDNSKKAETFGSGFKVAGGGELYIDGNAASGHCQLVMTRSDRSWMVANETNFRIYTQSGNQSSPNTKVVEIDGSGHFLPGANNTYDLGNDSTRWRNIYTNDLNLSNEGSTNDIDGTWGSYTIQEGSEDLFLINKRTGKTYKFNLTEVS